MNLEKTGLDLSVGMVGSSPELHAACTLQPVHIQWDYFARIEQVGAALKPRQPPKEQVYVGTVETLRWRSWAGWRPFRRAGAA